MNGIMDGILYERKRAEKAERERDEARAEVEQARRTSQFHKDNHLAAEAALAPDQPEEPKEAVQCCRCPAGLRWAGHYGEGLCSCACHLEEQP